MQKHRRQHAVLQLPVEKVIKYPDLHTTEVKTEEALLSDENEWATFEVFSTSASTPTDDYFSSSKATLRESFDRLHASFLNRNLAQGKFPPDLF